MKKFLILSGILFISLSGTAQDITGTWNGILKVQTIQLRIVFNITKTDSGYTSTMDSPDQGAKGIPVTTTTFENPILKIELPAMAITYDGRLENDTIFIGVFKQSGMTFPLNLTRSEAAKETIVRSQEPKKPYPYYTEDVKFENSIDGVVLAGTLSLPQKEGHFPAVILITGSGAQNRDEELMGHKPFLLLADYLTRKGIAVLRYDDRGVGSSTGNMAKATSEDFARDVEVAIKYLKSREEINRKKIGLIGHSEGGIIAPMVAVRTKDVGFIVLLAGPGVRGDKLLLKQTYAIGKASGLSKDKLLNSEKINRGLYEIILNSGDDTSLEDKLGNYLKQSFNEMPKSEQPQGISIDDYSKRVAKQLSYPWILYFVRYDPAPALKKVKCPVLAINGSKDLQVDAEMNLNAIKNALAKGGNKKVTTKELPGLNHLFQECKTGLPAEYAQIEQTFSPTALKIISDWILTQTKK
jgi:pimeloyl-ACP methyl ester carboxylesterase